MLYTYSSTSRCTFLDPRSDRVTVRLLILWPLHLSSLISQQATTWAPCSETPNSLQWPKLGRVGSLTHTSTLWPGLFCPWNALLCLLLCILLSLATHAHAAHARRHGQICAITLPDSAPVSPPLQHAPTSPPPPRHFDVSCTSG